MEVMAAQADDTHEAGFSGSALAGFNICGRHLSRCLRRREESFATLGGDQPSPSDLYAAERAVL
jgi:hypothetical protein